MTTEALTVLATALTALARVEEKRANEKVKNSYQSDEITQLKAQVFDLKSRLCDLAIIKNLHDAGNNMTKQPPTALKKTGLFNNTPPQTNEQNTLPTPAS